MQQVRQGDIFFQKITDKPEGLKLQKSNILVYGEVTGHAHRLKEGQVFTNDAGQMILILKKATQVLHEEHAVVNLDKGLWAVVRQREYTPEEIRTVVD